MSAPTSTAPTAETATQERADGSGRVARLADQAAEAARVRELTTTPDVIALRVERVRAQVDGLLWAGIVLGLGFTMVNVQTFAASGAAFGSPGWWVAWLLDPMVSLVLLAVLRAEQVTARYQVALPTWARRTKWLTFAATYVMNTWTSWGLGVEPFSLAGVVLHSVPPLVVFATAETGPVLRDRLTEAVHRALSEHEHRATEAAPARPVHGQPEDAVHDHAVPAAPVNATEDGPAAGTDPAPAPRRRSGGKRKTAAARPRRLLTDYVRAAAAELDSRRSAGESPEVSPAWCRQVTGCSAGTSVKVAAALRTTSTPSTADPITIGRDARGSEDRRTAGEEVAA